MRSIIQDGSDDWPPNEGEGAIHIIGGTIHEKIISPDIKLDPGPGGVAHNPGYAGLCFRL